MGLWVRAVAGFALIGVLSRCWIWCDVLVCFGVVGGLDLMAGFVFADLAILWCWCSAGFLWWFGAYCWFDAAVWDFGVALCLSCGGLGLVSAMDWC